MSMFEDNHYRWRETYFVMFRSGQRPSLSALQEAVSALDERYVLLNLTDDERGMFDSLTLRSPDDYAALDICYTSGAEVLEQGATLAEEIGPAACQEGQRDMLTRIQQADARFDVLHFEQVPEFPEESEEPDEMLDPTALLLVLGSLAKITDGIALDPQGGAILSEED